MDVPNVDVIVPDTGILNADTLPPNFRRTLSQPTPPQEVKPHLVILQSVYYVRPSEGTTEVSHRTTVPLGSDESMMRQQVKVGESWQPLDLYWLNGKGCSVLSLVNMGLTTANRLTNPTPEQVEAERSAVIEVALAVMESSAPPAPRQRTQHDRSEAVPNLSIQPMMTIAPKGCCLFTPMDGAAYLIRCRAGEVKLDVAAFPA